MNLEREEVSRLLANADAHRDIFITNGKKFWAMPELAYREFETSAYAVECLEKMGLTVKKNIAITGFRADLDTGRPGPTVALMGEMDALMIPTHPEARNGIVHACGHHTHINSLVGAAWLLTQTPGVLDSLCGKIAFIGTPAEEGFDFELAQQYIAEGRIKAISGKVSMLRDGVFNDVDVAFMNHCSGSFCCRLNGGNFKKRVVFHGRSCHAANPYRSINAMSELTLAQCAIGLLRERMTPGMRIHGIITEAGTAANVIPDTASMNYYIRGASIREMIDAGRMFDEAVRHSAQALGGEAEIFNIQGTLPVKQLNALGSIHALVSHRLVPDASPDALFLQSAGCTDVGDISTVLPTIHGNVPGSHGMGHGANYCTPDDELAYVVSVKHAALMLWALLADGAAAAKAAMEEFGHKLSIEEYERIIGEFMNA